MKSKRRIGLAGFLLFTLLVAPARAVVTITVEILASEPVITINTTPLASGFLQLVWFDTVSGDPTSVANPIALYQSLETKPFGSTLPIGNQGPGEVSGSRSATGPATAKPIYWWAFQTSGGAPTPNLSNVTAQALWKTDKSYPLEGSNPGQFPMTKSSGASPASFSMGNMLLAVPIPEPSGGLLLMTSLAWAVTRRRRANELPNQHN